MEKELSFDYKVMNPIIAKIIIGIVVLVFLFVGLILFLLGLVSIGTEGDLFEGLKYMIPGTTIFLFTLTGYLYSKISEKNKITSAYFDLDSKRFYLVTKGGESGYIPFGEIQSLDMRTEVVRGNKTSTAYYVVYFIKKDGAWWDIVYYRSEISARKKLNELQSILKFEDAEVFNILEKEKQSDLFTVQENSGGILFKWKENVSGLYRVVGLLAVISFLTTFGIIAAATNEPGSVGRYIVGIFTMIFGGAVLFGIYKYVFGYRDYELEINQQKVIFYGVKKEKRKSLSEMSIQEIKYTQYSFNMLRNDLFNGQEIYILNSEFADKIEKYKRGDLSIGEMITFAKDVMQMKNNVIKLPFPGFKSLDIILFEKKLDEELRKINPELK